MAATTEKILLSKIERQSFSLSREEWGWAFAFLISMSMTGLNFPLGYIALPVILINRYLKDRYDFIIQLSLLFGGYAFIGQEDFPLKMEDVALLISFLGVFIYRKTPEMKKITLAMLLYTLAIVLIAKTSEEAMSVQIRRMRSYLMFFYVFIPLMAFSGRDFDIQIFFRKIIAYTLIICAFYAIDGFILNGFILIPNSFVGEGLAPSTFYAPFFYPFPRKYPPGLFLMALCIIPVTRYYKLSVKQWLLVVSAFAAARTLSVIGGLLISYGIFQGQLKRMIKFGVLAVIGITAIYHIDASTGSFLRVQSTIDQFIALDVAEDEEDLAEFGTGRIAQTLPKMELLYDLHREWLGFGFLHPELTTNPKFWIHNELYVDVTQAEEVATGVEIAALQTILDIGYIGLIIQTVFFLYLYYVIRRFKYSMVYVSTLVVNLIFGVGGFAGLNHPHGLILVALSLAVVILSNKTEQPILTEKIVTKNYSG